MSKIIAAALLMSIVIPSVGRADTDQPERPLERANRISSLTGLGAKPFHIKLTVSEPANPKSPYTATIDEFWQSPRDWYRTIESPGLRELVVVSAGMRSEQNIGAYYPLWLQNFVKAAVDPLEDTAFWEQVSARIVENTSTDGSFSSSCARAQFKIGTAATNNDAFAVICFDQKGGLSSVVRPGYDMEFQDLRSFGKKKIAYRYVDNPEPGTELVGTVDVLEKLDSQTALTPPLFVGATSGPIEVVSVGQDIFEGLRTSPAEMVWPPVHSGNITGRLSMYVLADRDGKIREAYPLNSDNAGLQEAARDQLLNWQLKPAASNGQRVQIQSALTFVFSTAVATNAAPEARLEQAAATPALTTPVVISQLIANSLRIKGYAPVYPQALKERKVAGKVRLSVIIGKQGQVVSITPVESTDPEFTRAAIAAVHQWVYRPYLLNGLPVEVETVVGLVFQAP